MPNNTTDVAERFVALALNHKRWDEIKTLPAGEIQVLFDTVSAAGFDAKKVVVGKLVGRYRDQDGPTSETYPINSLCPFKVIDEDGDHYFATGWLDCALRRVVYGWTRQNEGRDMLAEAMAEEIERSIPLEPIQLTPEGDLLRECQRSPVMFGFEYFVNHTRDRDDLSLHVGVHAVCNCYMVRVRTTETHDAIVCQGCHLRVLFPNEVKTYGDLRQSLTSQRVQVSA